MPEDEPQFPSNSRKSRTETEKPETALQASPPRLTKVVTQPVTRKKKNWLDKIGDFLLGEDAQNVGSYVLNDVLIPAAKDTILEMVKSAIEMRFYGDSRRGNGSRRDKDKSYVSYGSYYSGGRDRDRDRGRPDSRESRRSRLTHDFGNIVIATRGEAQEVLSQLVEQIDNYDVATVYDFYDLVDETPQFTDQRYGWDNLSEAYVERVRDGYILNLPKPMLLKS